MDGGLKSELAGIGVWLNFTALFLFVQIGFCSGIDGGDQVEMGEGVLLLDRMGREYT